jgi:hypothetical protein
MSASLTTLHTYLNPLRKKSAASGAHISSGRKREWKKIPNAQEALLLELQKMYWNGVRRELIHVILTLKAWQHPDFRDVELEDEKDKDIYGFDTFLDQVNESSREFALQYGQSEYLSKIRRSYR